MKPLLTWKYGEKLSGDVKDVGDVIGKFLPEGDFVYNDEEEWLKEIEEEKFELPEQKIVYKFDDNCRLYRFNLSNDEIGKKLLKRSQILTLFFIEAGSYIEVDDDDRWELYVMYDKVDDKDEFIGFTTVYKYWKYMENGSTDYYRGRISQVLVLPPFQGRSYGRRMYESIVDEWRKDDKCVEITVEDPSEEFDELRDKCDVERFIKDGLYRNKVETDDDIVELQKVTKLTEKQLRRVVEMVKLWKMGESDDDLKTLRLLIKRRIYLQNREGLEGMDPAECRSKLEETYLRVLDGYRELVAGVKVLKRRAEVETE